MSDIELEEQLEILAAEMVRRGVNSWGDIVGRLLDIATDEGLSYSHALKQDDDRISNRPTWKQAIYQTVDEVKERVREA